MNAPPCPYIAAAAGEFGAIETAAASAAQRLAHDMPDATGHRAARGRPLSAATKARLARLVYDAHDLGLAP